MLTDQTITATARGTTVTARIRRDRYGVPHIYSDSDDGVIFGAGYVTAQDRSLLLDQARDNGLAGAIDIPGAPAIELILGLYSYKPTAKVRNQVIKQQDKSLEQAGSKGRQVLRDIDTYLVGHQQVVRREPAGRAAVRPRRHLRAQRGQGAVPRPGRRRRDPQRAVPRHGARRVRQKAGTASTRTCACATTPRRRRRRAARRRRDERPGEAAEGPRRLEKGSFRTSGVRSRAAPRRPRRPPGSQHRGVERPARQRGALHDRHADHGRRPADRLQLPRPDAGDGPLRADAAGRGRDLRPVPGLPAHRPRRGLQLDADLRGRRHHRHVRREALWRLAHEVRLQGQVPQDGDGQGRHDHQGRRQREGALPPDRPRARRRLRACRGLRERRRPGAEALQHGPRDDDQIFFQHLSTGRVRSAQDFVRASAATPQTFNSFYADKKDIAFVTTGRLPGGARASTTTCRSTAAGSTSGRAS